MKAKRTTAILIMILVIAAVVVIGPVVSLRNMRDDTESQYYYDENGYSIDEGILARKDAANNILKIAAKYEENSELKSQASELEHAVKVLDNNYNWAERDKANKALDVPAQELMKWMAENVALSEADQRYLTSQTAELSSQQDKMNRSAYNEGAESFNARLADFPGSILKSFGWIEPLPTFY